MSLPLSGAEGALLLRIARESIAQFLASKSKPDVERYPLTEALRQKRSAFVTLRLRSTGAERGCIGFHNFRNPLAVSVRNNAVNAAFRDPRFAPLTEAELNEVLIEVAALVPGEIENTPFFRVRDPLREIALGLDGLYVKRSGSGMGALLMPEASRTHGWSLEQLLDAGCKRAGLTAGAWRGAEAEIFRFRAERFAEE